MTRMRLEIDRVVVDGFPGTSRPEALRASLERALARGLAASAPIAPVERGRVQRLAEPPPDDDDRRLGEWVARASLRALEAL